jgi:hypothetical protein
VTAQGARTTQRARKAASDAEYARNRAVRFRMASGRCEIEDEVWVRCVAPGTEVHHIKRRSHTGTPDHSLDNLILFCTKHHRYVHEHVRWAKERSYIVSAWPPIHNGH